MNSAYHPADMAQQHVGMPPPGPYAQPPMQHGMPPQGAHMDPYQQNQHPAQVQGHPLAGLPPSHPQHPHAPLQPHPHQQPPPTHNDNDINQQIKPEERKLLLQPVEDVSRVEDGSNRRYRLDVVQQPERARMCGYGDKDRRPITPPPCVRLVITDAATGKEINCKDIDYTMFVLNVDLWNETGTEESNLCRQPSSTGAPVMPTGSGYSYSAMNGNAPNASMMYAPAALHSTQEMTYPQQHPMGYDTGYANMAPGGYVQQPMFPSGPQTPNGTYGPPQEFTPHMNQPYAGGHAIPTLPSQPFDPYHDPSASSAAYPQDQYKGALNRNLIGSVSASAFCLTDTSGREGIWFVLQDLSVRLEGRYKLRFSFVNVGHPGAGTRDRPSSAVRQSRAAILASCCSSPFQVFSAKKFPGVWESTPLSKTFATQGIKIPIRKDGDKGGDNNDDLN